MPTHSQAACEKLSASQCSGAVRVVDAQQSLRAQAFLALSSSCERQRTRKAPQRRRVKVLDARAPQQLSGNGRVQARNDRKSRHLGREPPRLRGSLSSSVRARLEQLCRVCEPPAGDTRPGSTAQTMAATAQADDVASNIRFSSAVEEKKAAPTPAAAGPSFAPPTKLEPFILLGKSARGAGAAKLIEEATAANGCYVFGELRQSAGISEVRRAQTHLELTPAAPQLRTSSQSRGAAASLLARRLEGLRRCAKPERDGR